MILDMMLINEKREDVMRDITVQHLAWTSSDHAPLLISLKKNDILGPRYFKLLDFLQLWKKSGGSNKKCYVEAASEA